MGIGNATRMGVVGLLLLAANAMATPAAGAEIHGRSSTQLLMFNDLSERRQLVADEYLRLGVTGLDPAGKFNVYGYGRLGQDFTGGDGGSGRLYYLYGEANDLYGKADVKVGRQFVNLAAGSALIDGVQVDIRNIGPVAVTVLGGRDVVFAASGEAGYAWNSDFGVAARLDGLPRTDLELSYLRKWDHGAIARDTVGMAAKQYLFNAMRLYGNARFDLAQNEFSELLGGVTYYPLANLVLTGEYYQSYPTFDATSVYAVFAVNQYQEGSLRADYQLSDRIGVHAGYSRQGYGEGAAANVYKLGTSLRLYEPLLVNVEYDNRQGYYGSMNGIMVDAAYDLNKAAQLGAGFTYDVYQRDAMVNDDIARQYWVAASYRLTPSAKFSARLQDDVNARYTSNVTGRFVFDYDF